MCILPLAVLALTVTFGFTMPAQKGDKRMHAQLPMRIQLSSAGRHGLKAVLENCSSHEQTVLHNDRLQPCKLVLVDSAGKEVPSFDTRSIEKFDNTVYRSMYVTLPDREKIVLHDVRFTKEKKDGFELFWNPYQFEHLKPGIYRAYVTWHSSEDSWTDSETGGGGMLEGVWKGTITSNSVTVRLR